MNKTTILGFIGGLCIGAACHYAGHDMGVAVLFATGSACIAGAIK